MLLGHRIAASLGSAAVALALACPSWAGEFFLGPYQDVTIGLGRPEPRIATRPWLPREAVLSWAFATGECGSERWGDVDGEAFARANVGAARERGQRYVVSTGGALGSFTCAGGEGMARFLARYDSPMLAGLDFDIEGAQTPLQIDTLVAAAAAVRRPGLRLSFTIATHAAADGSRRSLNATGEAVLAALRRHRLDDAIINLMVMNYGPPDQRWCVPRRGGCDMGRSAIRAAQHVHRRYGVPLGRIALTVMPGENDVERNVFTLADAHHVAREVRRLGLAGLHHWSLERDQPCAAGEPRLSPRCHALPGVPAGAFGAALAASAR